jgi:hypothetical protein
MEEITTSGYQDKPSQEGNLSVAIGWLLRVRGLVDVAIEDEQGRRIGRLIGPEEIEEEQESSSLEEGYYVSRHRRGETAEWVRIRWGRERGDEEYHSGRSQDLPNLFEVTIPGTDYNPGQNFNTVFLSQPGSYVFRFVGHALTAVDIYLTAFSRQAMLDTIFFQGIPMSERSHAEFTYNTNDPSTLPVLILVDHEKVQEIRPTAILSPTESEDFIPPRTNISIDGREVVLSATDNPGGSGVLHTYYTTDAQSFSLYHGPFLLPLEAKIIMAFSIDRNGNREYPGAVLPVLGLSHTQLVFRAAVGDQKVMPQTVSVLNLDPIPVTGPLEWIASKDDPWLVLGKREGKTPDLITISVNIGGLEPGIYSGNVIVKSPTPGVVYAERVISVILGIRPGQEPLFL